MKTSHDSVATVMAQLRKELGRARLLKPAHGTYEQGFVAGLERALTLLKPPALYSVKVAAKNPTALAGFEWVLHDIRAFSPEAAMREAKRRLQRVFGGYGDAVYSAIASDAASGLCLHYSETRP